MRLRLDFEEGLATGCWFDIIAASYRPSHLQHPKTWTGPKLSPTEPRIARASTADTEAGENNNAYTSNSSSRDTLGIESQQQKYDDGTSRAAARTDRGGGENAGSRAERQLDGAMSIKRLEKTV